MIKGRIEQAGGLSISQKAVPRRFRMLLRERIPNVISRKKFEPDPYGDAIFVNTVAKPIWEIRDLLGRDNLENYRTVKARMDAYVSAYPQEAERYAASPLDFEGKREMHQALTRYKEKAGRDQVQSAIYDLSPLITTKLPR